MQFPRNSVPNVATKLQRFEVQVRAVRYLHTGDAQLLRACCWCGGPSNDGVRARYAVPLEAQITVH